MSSNSEIPQAMESGDFSQTFAKPDYQPGTLHEHDSLDMFMLHYENQDNAAVKGEQLTMAAVRFKGTLDYQITDWLSSRITAKVWTSEGYAESRLGNYVPPEMLRLYEAYLEAKPLPFFSVQAGAINQATFDNEILIGDSSFPGVAERLTVGGPALHGELRAEQAIPTATTLSTNTVDAEPTPSFFLEQASVVAKPISWIQTKVFVTHFQYNDLPSIVANTSLTRGNTVDDTIPNDAQFAYGFGGFVYGGSAKVDVTSHVSVLGGAEMIQNLLAPSTYNLGQATFAALEIKGPNEIVFKPRIDAFFIESDAAPAYYMEDFYGAETNRTGWSVGMKTEFKRQRFAVGVEYMHFDPINANQWQSPEQLVFFNFETHHDLF